jgi:hypothetical protein
MSCYISSNNNRLYAAVETSYGSVGAITGANRFPAVRLEVKEENLVPARRDKTGGRTFVGMPAGFRKRNTFGVSTYMAAWGAASAAPGYGPLIQGALGGAGVLFGGATVQSASGMHLTFSAPHGLIAGQAVSVGEEIRFAEAIVDPATVALNAPFTVVPAAGSQARRTITYRASGELPSVSLFDYWDPEEAVQRIIAGGGVERMSVRLNGDFHQFRFEGEAREVADSASFSAGVAGLTAFPAEPAAGEWDYSLVPGNLGQIWMGTGPSQFFNVVDAEVVLDNGLDWRKREFGVALASCLSPGLRRVNVDMRLLANDEAQTREIYQAAKQRSPIPMMFQLGQQMGQLCGVYLKSVVAEVPEFDDRDVRLEWRLRGSRAQGIEDDEIVVAFA